MERKTDNGKSGGEGREARLKAALKANLSRRKAQAKARAGTPAKGEPPADTSSKKDK
ncbi:hypothetical protein [Salipiger aestuarii]|uniref:hypothetical protein n=1 Tax=Salipiger aestuarii TaxID=568098 RepID=UPI00025B4BAB|nr:hypothetical protein [Salipiger aestuarii]EIE50557.1 hypothetical protein C357_13118 [Citreicella sp. 357]